LFRTGAKNTLYASCVIILLTFLCSFRIAAVLAAPPLETAKAELSGIITTSSTFGRGQALVVQTNEGTFVVKRPISEIYKHGERVSLRGWIKPFSSSKNSENSQNNSGFDEEAFWKSKGAAAELVAADIKKIESASLSLHSLRQLIHDKFKSMPETLRGYLDAMWTGVRYEELNAKHQRWGTIHLLAVSGFHVTLVAGMVEFIFYYLRSRVYIRGFVLSFLIWIYIAVSGSAPSAIRSAFMFQVGIFSGILGRRIHAVNSVAVAASLMLLYSPFLFWNVGWRLSVIAAFTITAISELILNERLKAWTWAFIPPAVFITTYPVVASVFGSVPAVGIVINFFAVPFFGFAFPFISIVALSGVGILQNVTDASLRLYGHIADIFSRIMPWNIPYDSFLSMFCVLFFYWLVYSTMKNKKTFL
jgi:competence protein ComEC